MNKTYYFLLCRLETSLANSRRFIDVNVRRDIERGSNLEIRISPVFINLNDFNRTKFSNPPRICTLLNMISRSITSEASVYVFEKRKKVGELVSLFVREKNRTFIILTELF